MDEKNGIKIYVMLFKNWKYMFKFTYQMGLIIYKLPEEQSAYQALLCALIKFYKIKIKIFLTWKMDRTLLVDYECLWDIYNNLPDLSRHWGRSTVKSQGSRVEFKIVESKFSWPLRVVDEPCQACPTIIIII